MNCDSCLHFCFEHIVLSQFEGLSCHNKRIEVVPPGSAF
jgi:hypothetical protein